MSYAKSLFLCIFTLLVVVPGMARADIFVWQNQDMNVSLTYPDRWGVVNNHAADEVLRIAAPAVSGVVEAPQCRMRVRDDTRFKMHPVSHGDEIQRHYYSLEFWDDYITDFKHAHVNLVQNNAGLGRGNASYADITFESHEHPKMIRRGLAYVALYNNQVHIVECSAEKSAYYKWYPAFMGIIKSVDFDQVSIKEPYGYYRDFYQGRSVIKGRRPIDDYTF